MAERAGLLPQQADVDPMIPSVALESASHLSCQQLAARTLFWHFVIKMAHDFSIDIGL